MRGAAGIRKVGQTLVCMSADRLRPSLMADLSGSDESKTLHQSDCRQRTLADCANRGRAPPGLQARRPGAALPACANHTLTMKTRCSKYGCCVWAIPSHVVCGQLPSVAALDSQTTLTDNHVTNTDNEGPVRSHRIGCARDGSTSIEVACVQREWRVAAGVSRRSSVTETGTHHS